MMSSLAVIPARYASTRFPGKALAEICGKPMVQWVYERTAASSVDQVCVATDDSRILDAVKTFGGNAVMTSPSHPSGTDRVFEAAKKFLPDAEVVINVQGDEPLIPSGIISKLNDLMKSVPSLEMATVAVPCPREAIASNPNVVKLVLDKDSNALYFSRSPIPFLREGGVSPAMLRHWGIYAFKMKSLDKFVSLPESSLEKCEKLEQLRALENGIKIRVVITDEPSIGVDTPADLEELLKYIRTANIS